MRFEQAIPIVEGKLYSYAVLVLQYPGARISNAYREVVATDGGEQTSEQERWVMQHQYELMDAAAIDRVLRRLPSAERDLVRLRYLDRERWRSVAESLHVCEREVYRIRDRVLMVLAYELGLLARPEEAS